MPSVLSDIDKVLKNKDTYFKYLPIKNIYVIAPANVKEHVDVENDSRIIFVNENEFADAERVKSLYSSRTNKNPSRAGWYIQQFIKMQFARYTSDEYYFIWDSDTIPLKQINMFDEDSRPYFDMKTEYHVPYFDTISKILPGICKAVNKSFISEHMLVKSEYMREMLHEIENNKGLEGSSFWEKIIKAINVYDLPGSGFSEFETFGNYVLLCYPDSYILREWHSLREVCIYDTAEQLDVRQMQWLSRSYDAVSI